MTRDLSQSACGHLPSARSAWTHSRWWYQSILHNQSELAFKLALLRQPGVVVTSVPFVLRE